jgi:hypothetical protein
MMGDQIVLRLNLWKDSDGREQMFAVAFTYWMEDSLPIGSEVWYGTGELGEGFKPLELKPLHGDPAAWERHISELSRSWPTIWCSNQLVVCTRRRSGYDFLLPPSHPEVLHHLARFEGLALEAERHAGIHDRITYGIVAKRLGGLVRASVASWVKLLG